MQRLARAVLCLTLAACGDSGPDGPGPLQPPADAPGVVNVVPPLPPKGESRPGGFYDIYLSSPTDPAEVIAITVFEPATLESGQTYPLILQQHGFGGSRDKDLGSMSPTAALGGGTDIAPFVANGYGVISIDQRGHGESGGSIRAMDPDYEGRNLVAILDWAEARLGWIKRGPDLDGGPDNLVVGAVGGSYGGGFQMVLHAIDPRRRLDALIPQISWNDLSQALLPNGVIKIGWVQALYAVGTAAGSGLDRAHFDSFATQALIDGLRSNAVSPEVHDFYRYHGLGYFCDGLPVASNGGNGTLPGLPPRRPGAVHAMFFQGMRDTLFNFNEAHRNYQCLKALGGDVRLLSYEGGHNSLLLVPDPGALVYQEVLDGGAGSTLSRRCGELDHAAASMAFFDQHLKGIAGAADALIPKQICISLGADDRELVDQVIEGSAGSEFLLPPTTAVAGLMEAPAVVDLGYVAPETGAVVAGIPELDIELTPAGGLPISSGEPILFFGLGRYRIPTGVAPPPLVPPLAVDLIDNQITPVRGYGHHRLPMVGVGERLAAGDRLVLLIYGGHDQYHVTGSLNIAAPVVAPITISGRLWAPLR